MDERAFGITRPFHDRIRIGRANPGQLSDEIEVATRISFLGSYAHAELLAGFVESVETALAEIIVDVKESETFEVRHFLVDEVDHVADQLAVGDRRPKHPLVTLRRDALSGPAHDNLRQLFLAEYLRGGEARRTAHAADSKRHLIAGREATRHHGRLFGLAGVVADHDFDLPTQHAAARVLEVRYHLDRLADALALCGCVSRHRSKGADLDRPP